MSKNIYREALIKHLRFTSTAGLLSTEQLFELPLTSANQSKPSLDSVARAANDELKALTEESFVSAPKPGRESAELKLEIVKDVIALRQAEAVAKAEQAARAAKKKQVGEALARAQQADLEGKSVADLQALYDAL